MQGAVSYQFVYHALAQVRLQTRWVDVVSKYLICLHIAEARWRVEGALCGYLMDALLQGEKLAIVPVLNLD